MNWTDTIAIWGREGEGEGEEWRGRERGREGEREEGRGRERGREGEKDGETGRRRKREECNNFFNYASYFTNM